MHYNPSFHYRQVLLRYKENNHATKYAGLITTAASAFAETLPASGFAAFSTQELLYYIHRTHVFYLKTKLPEIGQTIHALGNMLWHQEPRLLLIQALFTRYTCALEEHICEEETSLLPYIDLLDSSKDLPVQVISSLLLNASFSIETFEQTHADTEGALEEILNIIRLYKPNPINSSLHRILIYQLESFETDLKVHAFIEDEVLIPRVKQLKLQLEPLVMQEC